MIVVKIICIVGTRPEAIKMAPIILALQKESWVNLKIVATTQHRQMLHQVLALFHIKPHIDLDVMQPNQSLTKLTSRLLLNIDDILVSEKPDMVLVQGDTTTVMAIAMACFYHHIPIGHVEAGLRTGRIDCPFPEEMNRVVVSKLATWHFAPTKNASQNLLKEGIAKTNIVVTGNSIIDALLMLATNELKFDLIPEQNQRMVLFTAHRRESFGEPLRRIYRALNKLAYHNPNVQFLYPVHPNPQVYDLAHAMLNARPNIHLCEPLDYLQFIAAMKHAHLIITDSGGVQEEAPALGVPVLVLRDETERPEAVELGVVKLVGSNFKKIVEETQRLLDDTTYYQQMAQKTSPYGDGKCAMRIVATLKTHFGVNHSRKMELTD